MDNILIYICYVGSGTKPSVISQSETPVHFAWLTNRVLPGEVGQACSDFLASEAQENADESNAREAPKESTPQAAKAAAAAIVSLASTREERQEQTSDKEVEVFKF